MQTLRLFLRLLQNPDLPQLIELWINPFPFVYLVEPRDLIDLPAVFVEETVDPFASEYDLRAVVVKETNQEIGLCGLLDGEIDGEDEKQIYSIFFPSAWEKGRQQTAVKRSWITFSRKRN